MIWRKLHSKSTIPSVIYNSNANASAVLRLLSTKNTAAAATATDTVPKLETTPGQRLINGIPYITDSNTNVTNHILSYLHRSLHNQPGHPLSLLKRRIVTQINSQFPHKSQGGHGRSPKFALFDQISPLVTPYQNFDSLLVPVDHPSRALSDSYYLNKDYMLRAHTSAHQADLIKAGLDHFLVVGDCYRRDEIDRTHYPVFHQCEAVSLWTGEDLFHGNETTGDLRIFEPKALPSRSPDRQEVHTTDAVQAVSRSLKSTLTSLATGLFGPTVQLRWVDVYFPFTHPSWELEVYFNGEWIEVLGCGVCEHKLLADAGVKDKIGWAFGIGLERLAMKLYEIPDIRLFWSKDTGFLQQFAADDPSAMIKYKQVSIFPQCANDISFWLPSNNNNAEKSPLEFSKNDFYDLVRSIGTNLVEQVQLVDEFYHKKKQRHSQTYRIIYRHMEKTLTQAEANEIHKQIEQAAVEKLKVEIR